MSRDLVRASEIRQTLNTAGWRHIDAVLESVVVSLEKTALAEEVELRIVAAQREARVARKVLDEFRSRVQIAGSAEPEPQTEDSFLVAM